MNRYVYLFFLVLSLCSSHTLFAIDKYWTGATSTNWNTASNWNPSGIPTASDILIIDSRTNNPVISTGTIAEAQIIYLNIGATLTVNNGATLYVRGESNVVFSVNNSNLVNNGTIKLETASGGKLTNAIMVINDNGTITNAGILSLKTTSQAFEFPDNTVMGTLTNTTSGTFTIEADGRGIIMNRSGNRTINNQGIMNLNVPSFRNALGLDISSGFTGTVSFTNSGTINIMSGSIYTLQAFTNQACGKIILTDGNFDQGGGTATNAGLIQVSGTLTRSGGTFTNSNNGVLKYGTLSGTITNNSGSLRVNDNPTNSTIFTYQGTYTGTINGIYTNAAGTTSAGGFTAPNTFTPSGLPNGSQTLYASITPSGGGCTYVVPFTYTYVAPPNFTTDPTTKTVCTGSGTTFTVAASGSPTYQWQVNTGSGTFNNLSNSTPYSGVTGTTLTISNVTGLNGYQYRCVATNASGSDNSNFATLTVSTVTVTNPTTTTATQGTAFSQTFTANGGVTPRSFSVASGTLPPGLSLNTTTGVVSGTPTVSGSFPITVRATDANGCSGVSATYTLGVNSAVPTITGFTTIDNTVCLYDQISFTATVGNVTGSYNFTVTNGINPINTIRGSSASASTPFSLLLSASDLGAQSFTLTISANGQSASATTTTTTNVTVNALPTAGLTNNGPLSCTLTTVTLTASGGSSYTFANGSGTVLTGSGNTRSVTTAGTYSVTVANASGCVSTTTVTVTSTTATVTVTNPTTTTATQGTAFSQSFTASGGSGPYSYSLASGSLPTGVSLNTTTGVVSGTPTQSGSFPITVRATDANGCSGVSATYTLGVNIACSQLYTVTNTNDAGAGSLRQAMLDIAATTCPGPFTITTTASGTINLTSILPEITKDVAFIGPGANSLTVRRNSSDNFRIFRVRGNQNSVSFNGFTIADGSDPVGSAISNDGNTVTLTNCTLLNNQSSGYGTIYNFGALIVTNCLFTGNTANEGGGIYHQGSLLTVSNSTFTNNTATLYGGGISTRTGGVTITNSLFTNNQMSGRAAGIAFNGNATVTNCTISGNRATSNGGGISCFGGSQTLINTTITSNTGNVGGIQIAVGADLTLINCIVAGNTAPGYPQLDNIENTVNSASTNNVIGTGGTGGLTDGVNGNWLGVKALLAPLGNYGGPRQTHALLPGSPAINAGTSSGAPTADARGISRVGLPDAGSFESQGFTTALTSGNNQSAIVNTAFATPLVVTVSSANSEPVAGGVVTFTGPSSGASINPASITASIGTTTASASVTANATVGGAYGVTASANGASPNRTFNLTNTIGAPTITGFTTLDNTVCVGSSITFTATISNVTDSYNFTVTNGTSTTTGTSANTAFNQNLTASGSGSQSFSLIVNDNSQSAFATTNVTVNALPVPTVTSNFGGTLTCAQTSLTISVSGGSYYAFARQGGGGILSASGVIPDGMLHDGFAIVNASGVYSITTTVASTGCSSVTSTTVFSNTATVSVTNPTTTTATQGTAFSQTFTASGGATPRSFSLASGTLPAGLSLSSTGVLSGTPTESGTFNITVRATDANGCFGTGTTYTLEIDNPATASIGNRVYFDRNANGIQDAGEPGISGVTIQVVWAGPNGTLGNVDDVTTSTTTGADGLWNMSNLYAGLYRITATPPTGQGWTITDSYDNGVLSAANPVTPTLTDGQIRNDIDFGFRGASNIGDQVWVDRDGDGVLDAGESGIPAVIMSLRYDANNNNSYTDAEDFVLTTTTNSTGQYSFPYLPAGNYRVEVSPASLPDNATQTYDSDGTGTANTSVLALAIGQNHVNADFAYRGDSSVGGLVWNDLNHNGIIDDGEPGIPGLGVTLLFGGDDGDLSTTADNITYTTSTNTNSNFSFGGIFGGDFNGSNPNYRITITPSATYPVASYDLDGVGTPNTAQFTLANSQNRTDVNFGYYNEIPTIAGFTTLANTVCVGSPITFTATIGNVTGSYAYTVTNGTSTTTGTTSNTSFSQNLTASGTGSQSFTLRVSSNGQSANATTNVTVSQPSSATISYPAGPYCRNLSNTYSPTRSGTPGGTYSSSPAGLSINASTGQIIPALSTVGSYTVSYTIPAQGSCPVVVATAEVTITAGPTFVSNQITQPTCATATGTISVSATGVGIIEYSRNNGSSWQISGVFGGLTPSQTYTILARSQSATACTSNIGNLQINAIPTRTSTISYPAGPYCRNTPTTYAPTRSGTSGGAYTSSPTGLSINSSGTIFPTLSTAGSYTVSYTIPAEGGCPEVVATAEVTITAPPLFVLTTITQPTCVTTTGTISVSATGVGIIEYSNNNGSSWQTSGVFSGLTPSQMYTILARSQSFTTCTSNISNISIDAVPNAPTVSNPATTTANTETAFSQTFMANGGITPRSFSLASGTLPTGLSLNTTTGVVSGTPTQSGSFSITVRVTDANGCSAVSATYALLVSTTATVQTEAPTAVMGNSAVLGGSVTNDGGKSVSERGIVYMTGNGTPTTSNTKVISGSGTGPFSQTVTTLAANTQYSVRAYAINGVGTSYGSVELFTTASAPSAPIVVTPANGSRTSDNTPLYTGTAPPTSSVTITVSGTSVGSTIVGGSGDWSFTQPTPLPDATYTVSAVARLNGLDSPLSNTNTFTIDTARPTVSLTSNAPNPTSTSPIPLTITFSEPVNDFSESDLAVTNGTLSDFSGSSPIYTVNVLPGVAGTVSVSVSANVAQDFAGNGNSASNVFSIQYAPVPIISGFTTLANTVCVGSPITFIATIGNVTGNYNYTVTNGTSTTSGTTSNTSFSQNLTASGTGIQSFTLLVSSNGQSANATTNVTVNSLPTAGLTNNGPLSCTLTTVTLTASGGDSYTFANANGTLLGGAGNTRQVTSAGIYSVTVATTGGCVSTTTTTVTDDNSLPTNPSLTPTPSATLTCGQPSITLTATASGSGLTYVFKGPAGVLAGSGASRTVTSAGSYTVVITNASGCSVAASTTVFAETNLPQVSITPSSATLTCANPSATLTASGGGTYRWDDNSTNAMRSVSTSGTYSVTVTSGNGCTATATAQVFQDSNLPSVSITANPSLTIATGQSTMLTATGASSYRWSNGENSAAITVTTPGPYSVTGIAGNGCTATASVVVSQTTSPVGSFSITGVTSQNCQQIASNRYVISFTPQYSGTNGQPISFSVVNELFPTTASGPYTLQLYTDNPVIVLKAQQTGSAGEANFSYNWLAQCTSPQPNTPPRVNQPLADQVARVGEGFGYSIPQTTFTDNESPQSLVLTVSGLPAGLSFTPPAQIGGVPSVAGVSSVTVTATDSGGLSVRTSFVLTVVEPTATNTPPTLANPVPAQVAVQGQPFGLNVSNTFTDAQTPNALTLSASGLPSGLQLVGTQLSGTPSQTGTSTITLTATDPGGLSASTSFLMTVQPTSGTGSAPFAITAVTPVYCNQISANRYVISFQPQYSGLTGQAVSFWVVNEFFPTTAAGPYSLQLYTDNPVIVLKAQQAGSAGEASFSYNWLAQCTSPQPNTPPRVNQPLADQVARVGEGFGYSLPQTTFTDNESPHSLVVSVLGLPAGLSFSAPAQIGGVPSVSGVSSVTVTATDPGGLSVSTQFMLTVQPGSSTVVVPPTPSGFGITGVQLVSCETLSANRRRLQFTPQYSGLSGSPVSFSVVNELLPTTASGPYTLELYTDNSTIQLRAQQGMESASYAYNWLAACGSAGRQAVQEKESSLRVVALGNPVEGNQVAVRIEGVEEQSVSLRLYNEQGKLVNEQLISEVSATATHWIRLGSTAGVYLLEASTPSQRQVVKIIKQ